LYKTTAFLYEAIGAAFEEPDKVCKDILGIFRRHGIEPPGVMADLGAGTGLMSVLFATAGWDVYGVEISRAMITVAQAKLATLPGRIKHRLVWTQGDITDFVPPLGMRFHTAVCLCNTINHLVTWPQVEGFVRSAFQTLKPGGLLVLDSDVLDTFRNFFDHRPVVVWDDSNYRMTRACSLDPGTGLASHVARLEKYEAGGLQPLSEEAMQLRYHPESDLQAAFLAAGFELHETRPFNPFPNLYGEDFIPKVLWVLKKPG